MNKLKTTFCGIELKNPIIIASCPATETTKGLIKASKAGAGAAILKSASVFEKPVDKNSIGFRRTFIKNNEYYATSTFARETLTIKEAVEIIKKTRNKTAMPLFASLAITDFESEKWVEASIKLKNAGASLLHLDLFYLPQPAAKESNLLKLKQIIAEISKNLSIPVVPKLNNNIPAYLFADFFSAKDLQGVFVLDSLRVSSPIDSKGKIEYNYVNNLGMSSIYGSFQKQLTNHYLTIISKTSKFEICAGGGYTNSEDIIEAFMLGANAVMLASPVLLNGYEIIEVITKELLEKMEKLECSELWKLKYIPEKQRIDIHEGATVFKKAVANIDKNKCIGCGKCLKTSFCNSINENGIDQLLCDGCGFCSGLCPAKAINIEPISKYYKAQPTVN